MMGLVTTTFLNEHLDDEQVAIIDVRFSLTDPNEGKQAYEKGHIPGACYLDLNQDLASRVDVHGGNHPLPDAHIFAAKLGELGIDEKTSVYIYDEKNGMFAARTWWLLKYMGHEKVYMVDGGIEQWVAAGYVTTTAITTPEKRQFTPHIKQDMALDIEGVKKRLTNGSAILLDSRARERYLGKVEPLYQKAGHIPGAKNFFWKDVLDVSGMWKDPEALKSHFSDLPKDKEIVVSCGSGVSACPNVFALKAAGYEQVKLYPGSFSDWISYTENDIETKED